MISKDILAAHYAEYASQPDEWVQNMEQTKRSIVEHVLRAINFPHKHEPLKVVVLGASDKRYISIHQKVFASVTGQKVQMVTFDIDSEHLGGTSTDVILHDVTQPFPGAPYDIVFSHELMKFLTTEEQLAVLQRSYEALAANGVAMHIVHEPSILGTPELRDWQHRVSPHNWFKSSISIIFPHACLCLRAKVRLSGFGKQQLLFCRKQRVFRFLLNLNHFISGSKSRHNSD